MSNSAMKSSSSTNLTKVRVEFPRDSGNDDLNLLIDDEDFLANLTISDRFRKDSKTNYTPPLSMTSTGESLSPNSSDQNIPIYDDGNDGDEDQYYEDFSPEQSEFEDREKSAEREGESRSQKYSFDEIFQEIPTVRERKYKNGTRASLTFSNERVRQIDRDNQKLLRKIMENGRPTNQASGKRREHFSRNDSYQASSKTCNAEVNRRKQQRKIDHDNQILKRKLETISRKKTRPTNVS